MRQTAFLQAPENSRHTDDWMEFWILITGSATFLENHSIFIFTEPLSFSHHLFFMFLEIMFFMSIYCCSSIPCLAMLLVTVGFSLPECVPISYCLVLVGISAIVTLMALMNIENNKFCNHINTDSALQCLQLFSAFKQQRAACRVNLQKKLE